MNQTSNSNMPRSTAETLKQIQKQGLSISIVSPDSARSSFSLDQSVSKETKPIVTIDKTPKLPTRSSVATESKATISQIKSLSNSSPEVRATVGQSTSQSSFQDAKISGGITKSVNPSVTGSESRAFGSQSWSKSVQSVASENKVQATSNLENKTLGGAGRISQNSSAFSENKVLNTRTVQNISQVLDNKSQSRIGQISTLSESKNQGNQSRNQNQLSFEGKLQAGQGRVTISSPPLEVKTMNSNQSRSSQNFSTVMLENKTSGGQRTINQMMSNNQSKLNQNRSTEVKTPNPVKITPAVKSTIGEKLRPNINEQSSINSSISERSLNNPFRVASTLVKKTPSSEEKSVVKVTRVSQNVSVMSENQSSAQSKISQNMSMHSESKAVSQVVKVSSVSSEQSQKSSVSFDNSTNPPVAPTISTMSTPRGGAKRQQGVRVVNSSPVAKKKFAKRASPCAEAGTKRVQNLDASFSSEDGSPEDKQFFNMKGLTPGLTITPVGGNAAPPVTNPSTSGNTTKPTAAGNTVSVVVNCPSCQNFSVNLNFCDRCNNRIPATAQQLPITRRADAPSFVVTKNVTTSIKKQIVFQFQDQTCLQFQQNVQGKVMVETNQAVSPRSKGRPKTRRKYVEPVCYTLSSDEEEPQQMSSFHPVFDETHPQFFTGDSEGSKSEHSSNSELLQDENQEFDDPQFPGVTDINEQVEMEEEPEEEEEEMEFENIREDEMEMEESLEEEEEEIPPDEPELDGIRGQKPTDYPLRCRSIRIGSYKIHPTNNLPYVPVNLSLEAISFRVPTLYDSNKIVIINLRNSDISRVLVHFGRCLPIMFVFTTPSFGEAVRAALHMSAVDDCYFDPSSRNDKIQKITFLIDSITDEQRNFIRHCFPGDKKVKELDQKEANEILVKSTPNQINACVTKIQAAPDQPPTPQTSAQKIIPPQPPIKVIKLLTYPPPPQTGGIAITTEDLHCLNEGEFLNDAIIDFYLKFIFNEKLTPMQREKTHIFSSFFYPRLTHKTRPGEETAKNIQVRRHNQVKTWTRHVDIFSKDFIIIPVNQNVHWFLAIICYPGKVPEVTESAMRLELRNNKSSDNVSSTVEQESNTASKVIIRELSNNGEGDSMNQDENSTSSVNSTYLVEEPPDSDEPSPETPDSTTHPDGKQRKEMPCICIFDSLSGPNRWRIPATLREYLEMEWKMKKGTKKVFDRNTMQGFVMKCPQQTNFSDCGTYLLQFVESFFENPIPYFGNPMPDLTNWFSELKISKKRQQLKELILSIHRKQFEASNARKVKPPDGVQVTPVTVQQTDNR